jgi:alpha-D-xyloside xylohydrolase
MKFTDGFWLMRPGVTAAYAAEAYDAEADGGSLTVTAPVRPIRGRGDTLNMPVLTFRFTSPLRDVVGVEVTHFAGTVDRGPHFELGSDGSAPRATAEGDEWELRNGDLGVRLRRGTPWQLDFVAGDRVLTSNGHKSVAFATTPDGGHHMLAQLSLGVGEHVYGLGERFTAFVKNGQVVDIWNADGGTGSEQAYKNVPFYLTDRGYGVFVDTSAAVAFEVASENVNRVQFSVEGQTLRYFVIHGATPAAILERYTALTGRPALPPAWSFGLWLSTSFTTDYDEATVSSFVDGMAERELPLSVFHFDCFWMREFNWCDFRWDPRTFPDPPGMLERLKARGLRISAWINPYIAQRSPLFEEGRRQGFLVRRADGSVWQWDLWQAGMGIVDFTNPEAREWFQDKLRRLLDMGVDSLKTDFGERIPSDVVWHDGSDPLRMHNYYTQLYNETVFEVLREAKGEPGAVVFARSATAGGQRFPVHWGGDNMSTFESMAETLRGGLSLALSGFGFWSHDMGGFEGTPEPAVFKRWLQFGLLSSHSRLHGSESYRVPWLVDDESVEVLRRFTRLKHRLMPYLYGAAVTAHREGTPMLRAMMLEFPGDPACAHLDRQYMLGPDLLVAPVLDPGGNVEYYLPPGPWTSLLTGETIEGGGWRREVHDFHSLPLLVRPGAVLPLGTREDEAEYDYAGGVTLVVHPAAESTGATVTIPDTSGAESAVFDVERDGESVCITRRRGGSPWAVRLAGGLSATGVEGGEVSGDDGSTVGVDGGTDAVTISLARG